MLHVLVVENNKDVSAIIDKTFSNEFQASVTVVEDARAALDLINQTQIDLVISRDRIDDQNTAAAIINYVYENSFKTQVLAIGTLELSGIPYDVLPIPFRADDLLAKAISIFRREKINYRDGMLPEYMAFGLSYFRIIKAVHCDVYLKMKKGGEDRYLKRINKGDEISGHNIQQYEDNPLINELYIHRDDRSSFYNNVFESALSLLDKSENQSGGASLDGHGKVYDTIQDAIGDFEISKETVEVTDKMTKQMQRTIMASDRIFGLIKHVLTNPGGFAYKHSYLTAIFGFEILKRLDTFKDKDQINSSFEKLIWTAFFHDIALRDEKHLKITNKMDFFKANLDEKEKELVSTHANKAATLVQSFSMAPSGVDIIIKQHHGTSNGIGFTDFYKSNISPLAIVFIVAEEFVVKILNFKERKETIPEILAELDIKFELPSYRKVLDALKDLLNASGKL